ncbi:MAG: restriction endonuclease [Gemmatimonadetes bacterium]|nr:restriction endonuclease [Gemmatimonadota bacterium]
MTRKLLPPEVKDAIIQVCGRAFWYKQPLFDMFARSGISEDVYLKYEHEAKFKIARQVLGDLELLGDEGMMLQRHLLTELYKLRNLPDSEVPDRNAGLDALRSLKEKALSHDLVVKEDKKERVRRTSSTKETVEKATNRESRLEELRQFYNKLAISEDRQASGYGLEDLLKEVFALYEIRYRKSYKADGEQIDGFFSFGGFDYIVESRWRKDQPSLSELSAFKGKVDRKIESTRGIVLSINGFKEEIVQRLREAGSSNLILFDGLDLSLILEGRVNLTDALQAKVDKAAQEGVLYYSLGEFFR